MGSTFTQAFIDPGVEASGEVLEPTGTRIIRVGEVTLFIEGTDDERVETLLSISRAAIKLADGIDLAVMSSEDAQDAPLNAEGLPDVPVAAKAGRAA